MLVRKESGKLGFSELEANIFFSSLFAMCQNQHEIDWVRENLQGSIENMADERSEELEK